ncbi:hypothetical protein PTSG_02516 [Salpingoeca rosetta]|uniref:GB1/RHD3-type G domain-containing protein n=1 Tax=Salpingoeca rosetta (strain ATCC 50818 / BSB-021) TaxID=946362 RepID=F2U2F2_SALR5|nr:uncharacterized protein PTSG_02516 [Salpingoeca rosetta]EGD81804.1 hypothetical protein PTSG_02516 [Salpingoeca rosetta]|eukprot:XP_004997008.1 hypothetical protein PTSG_02516 [Salpingoeca rosetta]
MYVTIAYPFADEDVDLQIDNEASFKTLGEKIVAAAPRALPREKLLSEFTVVVNRNGRDRVLNLTLEQPVSILLESNDALQMIPGIPPYLVDTEGRPLQVLTFSLDDDQHTVTHINEANLRQILYRHDVKDLPVVVLSVAGPFRTGKSFLLNFILRYLENDGADWGSEASMQAAEGFHWRHGIERDTVGMWMWSKPFVRTMPGGDRVAVIVADTQGTFDKHTVMAENTRIFALNALISSQQVYNIKEKISEDVLQQMHLFTEYGAMVARTLEGQKPFQNLEFLIRDWEFESHAPGAAGGQEYLDSILAISDDLPTELREVRLWLQDCYEAITCFLLPHPGKKVTKKEFTGNLTVLEEDFREHFVEFVSNILSPERIAVKKIGNQNLTCSSLLDLFRTYVDAFNTAELPQVSTLFQATARVNHDAVRQSVLGSYRDAMRRIAGPGFPHVAESHLRNQHEAAHANAISIFESAKLLGSAAQKDHLRADIERELETLWTQMQAYNRSKDILRGMRTPLIFAAAAFLLNIVAAVLDVVELDPIAYILNFIAWVGVFALVGWGTLNYTGQQPELRGALDSFADTLFQTGRVAVASLAQPAEQQPAASAPAQRRARAPAS